PRATNVPRCSFLRSGSIIYPLLFWTGLSHHLNCFERFLFQDEVKFVLPSRVACGASLNCWSIHWSSAAVSKTSRSSLPWIKNPITKLVWARCGWCSAHSRAPTTWGCSGLPGEQGRTGGRPRILLVTGASRCHSNARLGLSGLGV